MFYPMFIIVVVGKKKLLNFSDLVLICNYYILYVEPIRLKSGEKFFWLLVISKKKKKNLTRMCIAYGKLN